MCAALAAGESVGSATNPYEFLMSFFMSLIMLLTRVFNSACAVSSSLRRVLSSSFEVLWSYLWRERRLFGRAVCVVWRGLKSGLESYLVFGGRRLESMIGPSSCFLSQV